MSDNQYGNSMSVSSSSLGMQIWSNDETKEQSKQKEESQEMLNNCSKEIKEMLETVMTNVESGGGAAGSSGSGAHSSTCGIQTPTTQESTGVSSTASTQTSTTDDMTLLDLQKQLAILTALLTQVEQKVPSAEVKTLTAYNAAQVSEMEAALDNYNNYVSECDQQLANYNAAVAANQSDWNYQATDHKGEKDTTPIVTAAWWNPFDSNTITIDGNPDAVASEIEETAYDTTGIVVTVSSSSSVNDMINQANAQVNAGIQTEENAAYVKLEQQIAQCGPIGQLLAQELKNGEKLTPSELAKAIVNILQTEMAMMELLSQGGMAALMQMIQLFTAYSNKSQISCAQLGAATSNNTMAMNQASYITGQQLQAQEEKSLQSVLRKIAKFHGKEKILESLGDLLNPLSPYLNMDMEVFFATGEMIDDGKNTLGEIMQNFLENEFAKWGMSKRNSKLLSDFLLLSSDLIHDTAHACVAKFYKGLSRDEKNQMINNWTLGLDMVMTVLTLVASGSFFMFCPGSVVGTAAAEVDGTATAITSRISTAINEMSQIAQAAMILEALVEIGMGTASGVLHIEMSKLEEIIANKTYNYEKAQSQFEWWHNMQELTQTTNNAAVKSDSQVIQETQKSQTQMLGKLLDWQAQAAQMA